MKERLSSFRERLSGGVRGTFVKLPALEVIEIVSATLDFAVVDLEHSQLTEADALRLVRHAWALDFPALVRLPELDRGLVNRLLEAGAAGIQLSTVRAADAVRALREAALYAPHGTRSVSLAHPLARFGATPLADYVRGAQPSVLVAQLETLTTDDTLDAILGERPDVVFVGVTDLTVDAEFERDSVVARIDEIAAAAERAGVVLGGFGVDERWRYTIASSDLALLQAAYAGA